MDDNLPINFYHGTSTIFLDCIIKWGLGSRNRVTDLKLLELSSEVYELSSKYLIETDVYQAKSALFKNMTEQLKGGSFNWQHGYTFISPSMDTAARYAIGKRFGSEILTYTIDFLNELIRANIPDVKTKLFNKYRKVFGLIEANPSPIIIQVNNVANSSLLDEHGNDPSYNIKQIKEFLHLQDMSRQLFLQQCNFRLKDLVQKEI